MRTIVLWDIDNTLLYTGGAGGIGMNRAFRDIYGVEDGFSRVEFSGRSDAAIFGDAARAHGIAEDELLAERTRFLDVYIPHLQTAMHEVTTGRLMPGVVDLLEALDAREDVVQGLGTGNFRRAGELKLRHYKIAGYFPGCVGGFGEDSEHRHELVGAGIARLRKCGDDDRIVIIGDTPHDVSAAKANGAFALAVATGRDSVDELLASGADAAVADLSDVDRVIATMLGA